MHTPWRSSTNFPNDFESNLVKIYYDDSPAGAGKTERAIGKMVCDKRKTIFVTERRESFAELEGRIRAKAEAIGARPTVLQVHSGLDLRSGSVTQEVEDLPDRCADYVHVIVLITHAALLRSNFARFADWHIVIDEVPAFLDFEEKVTHLDSACPPSAPMAQI